jgi:oligosaccharide repeat unit polymerase
MKNYQVQILIIATGVLAGWASHFLSKSFFRIILFLSSFFIFLIFFLTFLKKKLDLFEIINWVFLYYTIGFVGLTLHTVIKKDSKILGLEYLGPIESNEILALTLFFLFLGLFGFLIGYYNRFGNVLSTIVPAPKNEWSVNRLKFVIIIYGLIGIFSFIGLVRSFGGVNEFLALKVSRSIFIKGSNKYLFIGITALKSSLFLWLTFIIQSRKKIDLRFFSMYFLLVLGILFLLGGRSNLLSIFLTLLVLIHYLRTPVDIKKISIAVFSILVIATTLWPFLENGVIFSFNILDNLYSKRNFDTVYNFAVLIQNMPENLEFQNGKTFVSALLSPFPSSVINSLGHNFQEAHIIFTKNFLPKFYENRVGVPVSFPGELYMNFGLLGILLGMIILGILGKGLYSYLRLYPDNKNVVLLYAISAYSIFYAFIGGNFSNILPKFILQIGYLLIAIIFINKGKLIWKSSIKKS